MGQLIDIVVGKEIDPLVRVNMVFVDEYILEPLEPIEAEFIFSEEDQLKINGKVLKGEELKSFVDKRSKELVKRNEKRQKYYETFLNKMSKLLEIDDAPALQNAIESGSLKLTTDMRLSKITSVMAKYSDKIARIELYQTPENEISIQDAMSYTNLNSYTYTSPTNGAGVGIYIRENGTCPNDDFDENYKRITSLPGDVTGVGDHATMVSAIALATATEAKVYCETGQDLIKVNDISKYDIEVENYSFNTELTNKSNEYKSDDYRWDDHVYTKNIAVFKSAGNESNITAGVFGLVTSPGKAFNVITVGNYDPNRMDGLQNESSFVNPETGNNKPEIIAPGTNIQYPGIFDFAETSGTSWASPHAAGFAADMMSKWSGFKMWAHAVKSGLMVVAEKNANWTEDKVGAGLIKFNNLYDITYNRVIDDAENSYLNTPKTYDFSIGTVGVSKRVKIVISWLNRGYFTINDPAKRISMDLNLEVRNLDTNTVIAAAQGKSENNPYEIIEFTANGKANYRVTISREDNNDPACRIHLTLFILEE